MKFSSPLIHQTWLLRILRDSVHRGVPVIPGRRRVHLWMDIIECLHGSITPRMWTSWSLRKHIGFHDWAHHATSLTNLQYGLLQKRGHILPESQATHVETQTSKDRHESKQQSCLSAKDPHLDFRQSRCHRLSTGHGPSRYTRRCPWPLASSSTASLYNAPFCYLGLNTTNPNVTLALGA